MLNVLAHPQTTNIDETTRRNFVCSQALLVLNSTLLENLSIHSQLDGKAIQDYLYTLMEISNPISVFTNCQKRIIFQIPSD